MKKLLLIAPLIAISLAACDKQTFVNLPVFNIKNWVESKKQTEEFVRHDWWLAFDDKILNQLIIKAKTQSPDIKIALARVKQARANEEEIIADQLPIFGANANVSRNKYSKNVTNRPNARGYGSSISAGFDALWEINYFGLEPALRGAESYTAIAEANYNQALVTLFGDVARNYFEIRKTQIQIKVAQDNINAQKDIVKLTESLAKAGKVSGADTASANTILANTEAEILPLKNYLAEKTYVLETLLGEKAGGLKNLLNKPCFINVNDKEYALATPAAVLAERPDIKAAEEDIKYRVALKDIAFAQYYPKISISALLGLESAKISKLIQGGSIAANAGAGLSLPIFDFGRIKAQVKNADAQTEEALAVYEKTVLTAVSEVESAVSAIENERKHFKALQTAYQSAKLSYKLANSRYKAGLTSYLNVLEAQKSLNQTSQLMAQSNADILINQVRLYKTLGGGWKEIEKGKETKPAAKISKPNTGKKTAPIKDLEIKLQENIDDKI